MADTLKLYRDGAVGFIVWLDGGGLIRCETSATGKRLLTNANHLPRHELPPLICGNFSNDAVDVIFDMLCSGGTPNIGAFVEQRNVNL